MGQTCLSSKVVQVLNNPFKNVLHARIWAVRVDEIYIVGDVVTGYRLAVVIPGAWLWSLYMVRSFRGGTSTWDGSILIKKIL